MEVSTVGLSWDRYLNTNWIESLWIRVVDSRNKVSVGGILWNTTLDIEDFPLLYRRVSIAPRRKGRNAWIPAHLPP